MARGWPPPGARLSTSPSGSSESGAKGHRVAKGLLPVAGAGDGQVEARFVFAYLAASKLASWRGSTARTT
jgi:hypothetical protein